MVDPNPLLAQMKTYPVDIGKETQKEVPKMSLMKPEVAHPSEFLIDQTPNKQAHNNLFLLDKTPDKQPNNNLTLELRPNQFATSLPPKKYHPILIKLLPQVHAMFDEQIKPYKNTFHCAMQNRVQQQLAQNEVLDKKKLVTHVFTPDQQSNMTSLDFLHNLKLSIRQRQRFLICRKMKEICDLLNKDELELSQIETEFVKINDNIEQLQIRFDALDVSQIQLQRQLQKEIMQPAFDDYFLQLLNYYTFELNSTLQF